MIEPFFYRVVTLTSASKFKTRNSGKTEETSTSLMVDPSQNHNFVTGPRDHEGHYHAKRYQKQ